MSGEGKLMVTFSVVIDHIDGSEIPESWTVTRPDGLTVLWGFGRKQDAEIALKFLESLPVDFLGEPSGVAESMKAAGYPRRGMLMRAACERLQW